MSPAIDLTKLSSLIDQPGLALWPVLFALGVYFVASGLLVGRRRPDLAEQLARQDVDLRLREAAEARLGRGMGLAGGSSTGTRERSLFPPVLKRMLRPVLEDLGWLLRGLLARFAPGLAGGAALERDLRLVRPGVSLTGYFAEKAGAALVWAVIPPALGAFGGPETPPLVWLAAAIVGFLLPDLDLRRRIAARQARIAVELPAVLDQLVIATSAGLSLEQGIDQVAQSSEGVVADELQRVMAELAFGRRLSLQEALDGLDRRNNVPEFAMLVGQLRAAHKQGMPVVQVLAAQADSLRERKKARIIEAGSKATVKMVIPIAVFILPVLAIVILVPAGVQLLQLGG
jgi:tight adherence protein C